ncbi:MAG: hypothetical protein K1060chlam1_01459, partial [Candidatus Anoxychlamydiales bacterium]|nr:hypothetical protein [Candidatus Anoxychlamydiales bacterium]
MPMVPIFSVDYFKNANFTLESELDKVSSRKKSKTNFIRLLLKKKLSLIVISCFVGILIIYQVYHLIEFSSHRKKITHVKNIHPDFVGRKNYLNKIASACFKNKNEQKIPIIGLWGEGGIGKSELAIAFSNLYKKHFSLIWWIESDNQESYHQSYRELARQLNIPFGKKELNQIIRSRVHHYLENEVFQKPWLLIFDNVDSCIDFPQRGYGAIMITSRNQEFVRPFYSMHIKPFLKEEASELFNKITGKTLEESSLIANQLDYIPFALNQAAHYIAKNSSNSNETYINIFSRYKHSMLENMPKDFRYKYTNLFTSWKVTSDYLSKEFPEALEWLYFCSYLCPDSVPREWIEKWIRLCQKESDEIEIKIKASKILSILIDHSLVRYDLKKEMISIHRLRQEILRNDIDFPSKVKQKGIIFLGNEVEEFKRLKGYEGIEIIEKQSKIWDKLHIWNINAAYFLKYLGNEFQCEEVAEIYDVIGNWRHIKADFNDVVKFRKLSLKARKFLGEDHDKVLYSKNNLAWALCKIGEYKSAESLFKDVLEKKTLLSGEENGIAASSLQGLCWCAERQGLFKKAIKLGERSLKIRENIFNGSKAEIAASLDLLSWVLERSGKYVESKEYAEQALAIRESIFGRKHTSVASSKHHLAWALQSLGEYDRSEQIHKEALEIRMKIFGEIHPATANSFHYLAWVLGEKGKYDLAEQYYKKVIEIREILLGKNHPATRRTDTDLAWVLTRQGRYEEAKRLYEQVISIENSQEEKIYIEIANAMYGLSRVLEKEGKYEEAKKLHEQELEIRKKYLGNNYPNTTYFLSSGHNLPIILSKQGKYEEAKKLHEKILKIRINVLGEEHPRVFTSKYHLAWTLAQMGKYEEAKMLLEQVIISRKKIFGEEHPYVATAINELGCVLAKQGQYKKARSLHEKALRIRKKVFERNHPYISTSMNDLAWILAREGRYRKSRSLYEKVLEIRKKIFGKDHFYVATSMNDLAWVLARQGHYNKARSLLEEAIKIRKRVLSQDHPDVVTSMSDLAWVLARQG